MYVKKYSIDIFDSIETIHRKVVVIPRYLV